MSEIEQRLTDIKEKLIDPGMRMFTFRLKVLELTEIMILLNKKLENRGSLLDKD